MTGRSLIRRLRSNTVLDQRFRDPLIVPLGARVVLEAVAELVAASEPNAEGMLEYRPDPDIDAGRSMVEWVARRADAVGAEAEVAAHLQALLRAELLVLTEDGALCLALPVKAAASASPRKAVSNRSNARYSVGPRRQGESDEAFALRKAEKRRQVDERERSQLNFALPIAGGGMAGSGEANGSQNRSHLHVVDGSQIEATVDAGFGLPAGIGLASHAPGLSAAAAVDIEDKSIKSAAAASATSRAGVHLASVEAKTEAKPEANGAKPTGFAPEPAAVASEIAVALARDATLQYRWDPVHARAAVGIMQGYLDTGYTEAAIRTVLADKRSSTTTSAKFLEKPLQKLFPGMRLGRPVAEAAVAKPLHAGVAANPVWAAAPAARRGWISSALEVLEMPAGSERSTKASMVYRYDEGAFLAVAERHPELWAAIDREPPMAAAG